MARRELSVISLFSGALGLDLGLEAAGFRLKVAVECNRFAAETIRRNRPDVKLIDKRIEDVSTEEILEAGRLKPGEPAAITGGPSCQAFSTAGQRGSIHDPRGTMFREFLRVVHEAQPRFFVMENVRGVLSAAVRHRPLGKRGPGHPELAPEEEMGSAFALIVSEMRATGYAVGFDVLNAADFGVPQVRERVVFMGSRDGESISTPSRTHARTRHADHEEWMTLRQALRGLKDSDPQFAALPSGKSKFLKLIPEGGNWRDLPRKMQEEALGKAFVSWGGRVGFFRRLSWRRPTPALTTRPDSKATMICHPTELRPLSVREYARIQEFPDDWEFAGGIPQQYIQIGNAVPVGLARAVGLALRAAMRSRKRVRRGVVVCLNDDVALRLQKRPKTVLNPVRMRKVKDTGAARAWLAGGGTSRVRFVFTPGGAAIITS